MNIPKVKDFIDAFKANSEKVTNLETEKLALENEFKTQAELVTSLQKENATHSESLVAALADITARDTKIKDLEKTIAEFNQLIADAEKDKTSAALEAKKIVASIGIPAVPITKVGSEETKASSNEDVINEYQSITDPAARFAFFTANKDKIINLK